MSSSGDTSNLTLPPHVYWNLIEYAQSEEYRDDPIRRQPEEGRAQSIFQVHLGCRNVYRHRIELQLHAWSSEVMANVCLWCHPEYATRYGVVILSWLSEERRVNYLTLLGEIRQAEEQRAAEEQHRKNAELRKRRLAAQRELQERRSAAARR